MYSYIKAVLRQRGNNGQYKEVNVRNLRLDQILNQYIDGYIELIHSQVISRFYVPLNDLRSMELPYGNNTFEVWLGQVSTLSLPSYVAPPKYVKHKIAYCDALLAGINMKRVLPVLNTASANDTPSSMRDILCTKDGFNGDDLKGKFLMTVNGMCHNTGYTRQGFVVFDGAATLDVSKNTTVGIMSFEQIGAIKTISLTEGRLVGEQLKSEMFIKCGESLVGKSVMISIGGYLHACDDAYDVIDEENGVIRINTPKIDIARRIMRCLTRMDLSSLGLSRFEYIDNILVIPEAMSNDILRRYMQLPQSFVIIVDTPHLYVDRIGLSQLPISGYTEYKEEPTLPMVDDYGHLLEYWKGGGAYGWSLISNPKEFAKHEFYNTGATETNTTILDAITEDGYDYHHYHLLEIGKQVLMLE